MVSGLVLGLLQEVVFEINSIVHPHLLGVGHDSLVNGEYEHWLQPVALTG